MAQKYKVLRNEKVLLMIINGKRVITNLWWLSTLLN